MMEQLSLEPTLSTCSNIPMPSPAARSPPNTPPISPGGSLLNSPAFSPTCDHANNTVPFPLLELSQSSPTGSPPNSAVISLTHAWVNKLPILPPEPSILEPGGEDHHTAMDLELPAMEIGPRKSG